MESLVRVADVTRERTEWRARAEGAEGENVILRGRVENWERENLEVRSLAQRESVRADTAERNGTEFRAQAEAEATELRRKIAVLTETSEALRSRLTDDEATDHITARISTYGPAILPHEFAAMCEDYAALRSISGRTRVSRQLLQAVISNPPLAAVLSGPGTPDSLKSHELHRQVEASLAFTAGRLQDAEHGFRALCTDLPSPFNFECSARTHLANNNQRDAFAALTDGTDRFPTDTALNVQLATFFIRIGDVEAANVALDAVRHAFVSQSFALEHLRRDVDLAMAHVERLQAADGAEQHSADAWWGQWRRFTNCNQFQDALVALGMAFESALAGILDTKSDETTSVIELGIGCGHTLASVARQHPQIRFFAIDPTRSTTQFNERMFRADNLTFLGGDVMAHLVHTDFGANPILFHGDVAGLCRPEFLAGLYARCRELGTRHILIAEDMDFDRITLRYHEADDTWDRVQIGSAGRLLHNFKALLHDAGYAISASTPVMPVLVQPLSTPDHRLLHATLQA